MIDIDQTTQWDLRHNAWRPLFSNFAATPITVVLPWTGPMFALTGEHAFQAAKAVTEDERGWILGQTLPRQAKSAGHTVPLRAGWDEYLALSVMMAVVQAKVTQYPDIERDLIDTWGRPIIEMTKWDDRRWGVGTSGIGANQLGQVWMQVREGLGMHEKFITEAEADAIGTSWACIACSEEALNEFTLPNGEVVMTCTHHHTVDLSWYRNFQATLDARHARVARMVLQNAHSGPRVG